MPEDRLDGGLPFGVGPRRCVHRRVLH
jgi:hypothetical protein